ncbi:histidine phosphatase family protein [Weissella cibaria]|uniref:histidine phosphatase family protein n=1 Tax=Weissella cibaria TaxID=137591 RepID=UPI003D36C9A9
MSITVYMVRHGQTYLNKYRRMQGWTNAPLTEKGIADDQAAGERLRYVHFDGAYSSDLARAAETARFVLDANLTSDSQDLVELPDFREQFFGSFDGLTGVEAGEALAGVLGLPADTTYGDLIGSLDGDQLMDAFRQADPAGDAEDSQMFWSRLNNGLDTLLTKHQDGDRVLLVVHGILLINLVNRFAGAAYKGIEPENGSITTWQLDENGLQLETFNDTTTEW